MPMSSEVFCHATRQAIVGDVLRVMLSTDAEIGLAAQSVQVQQSGSRPNPNVNIAIARLVGPSTVMSEFMRTYSIVSDIKAITIRGSRGSYASISALLSGVGLSLTAGDMQIAETIQLIGIPQSVGEVFGMNLPWAREFPDRWRTYNVVQLATTILEGRTDNLPILRDALLEADCDNEKIIKRVATLPADYWDGDSWLLNVCVRGLEATRNLLGEGDF